MIIEDSQNYNLLSAAKKAHQRSDENF